MVNSGGPSKGCLTCIKRKIRCDRGRPRCQQCQKANRQCGGYRDATDLVFRDQSQEVIAKARRSRQKQDEVCSARSPPWPMETLIAIDPPSPSEDNSLIDFLANNFTCTAAASDRNNIFWMPRNFRDLLKDECARLSAQSAAAMAMSRLCRSPYYLRESQKMYSRAVRSLNQLWQRDSLNKTCDTVFIAILFLGFFEVLACYNEACPQIWRVHLHALGSLFEQCEESYLAAEFGFRMLRQIRSQVVLNAIQTQVPVMPAFASVPRSDCDADSDGNKASDEADDLLVRLCDLQARRTTSKHPETLMPELTALDAELCQWLESAQRLWPYSMRQSPYLTCSWWDARQDVYLSSYVVYIYNKIRAARIRIFDLTQGLSALSCDDIDLSSDAGPEGIPAPRAEIQDLVVDICATVPAAFRPSNGLTRHEPQQGHWRLGPVYWWLWPLEAVGQMNGATPELTLWVVECFERIFELTGIKVAEVAADRTRAGAGFFSTDMPSYDALATVF